MVESMTPGSVIVDLAVERGGNVELDGAGRGGAAQAASPSSATLNVPGRIATSARQLYARNLYAFVETLIDKKTKTLAVNWDDELVKATVLTRDGAVVHPTFVAKGRIARGAVRAAEAAGQGGARRGEKVRPGQARRPCRRPTPRRGRSRRQTLRPSRTRRRRAGSRHGVSNRATGARGLDRPVRLPALDLRPRHLRRLLRRLVGDAGAAYAADDRHQRHLVGHRRRRAARGRRHRRSP